MQVSRRSVGNWLEVGYSLTGGCLEVVRRIVGGWLEVGWGSGWLDVGCCLLGGWLEVGCRLAGRGIWMAGVRSKDAQRWIDGWPMMGQPHLHYRWRASRYQSIAMICARCITASQDITPQDRERGDSCPRGFDFHTP